MLRRAACLLLPRPAAPHSATSTSASLLTPLTTWVRHLPTMKRRFRGLYGGKHIQFGNQISFSHRKSRRTWKPNVQNKRFFSELYQRFLSFRMTTSVIKQVKKLAGGIDEYLLTTSNEGLLYPKAIKLKKNMARLVRVRERDAAIATLSEGGNVTATSSETAAIVGGSGSSHASG